MSVKPYIGIDGKARNVSKAYIGIASKARAVVKAYIGINGKARCIFSGGDGVSYYGTADDAYARKPAAATIGNYALVLGADKVSDTASYLEAYSGSLARTILTPTTSKLRNRCAATNSAAAIFAGGYGTAASAEVLAYDSTLTMHTIENLSNAREYALGATVGDIVIFTGGIAWGSSMKACADAYDEFLTKVEVPALPAYRQSMAAVSGPNYAVFAGGRYGSSQKADAYAYDTSLTVQTITSLSYARYDLAGAKAGESILLAGGIHYTGTNYTDSLSNYVDAYDASLTKLAAPETLSAARQNLVGATLGQHAIFAGGIKRPNYFSTVDSYDASLVRSTQHNLALARNVAASATIGDYALFIAGYGKISTSSTGYTGTVDVFQLS